MRAALIAHQAKGHLMVFSAGEQGGGGTAVLLRVGYRAQGLGLPTSLFRV